MASLPIFLFLHFVIGQVRALGSMAMAATSYGENGQAFCSLQMDGSNVVSCYGSDAASVYGAPSRLTFVGLTAGDGFVCGLTLFSHEPYCWGNNVYVEQGVPSSRGQNITYVDVSAGDHHLCALRSSESSTVEEGVVDCWGYNVTGSFIKFPIISISSGSLFTCGLFASNSSPVCWGDETGSDILSKLPRDQTFSSISAGGYHVCGILKESKRTLCWGRSLDSEGAGDVILSSLVGGKFHECGLRAANHTPVCWGLNLPNATPVPADQSFFSLVAGDYFTCGIDASLQALCWGSNYPSYPPISMSPGVCKPECKRGTYKVIFKASRKVGSLCSDPNNGICVPCSQGCPEGMIESSPCGPGGDRVCTYNCSDCKHQRCPPECHTRKKRSVSLQAPIIIGELITAGLVVGLLALVGIIWYRYRASREAPAASRQGSVRKAVVHAPAVKKASFRSSFHKGKAEVWAQEELKIPRAESFKYPEIEQATGGFAKASEIGRGSFSCVFKGVLADGRVVAVKRATLSSRQQYNIKDSKDFHNELDLLSRLNHAHLLNLLGYCDENGERLLVYEFMAHGTLHEHLHGRHSGRLSWIRRVKIAVQAARGLEYLHGYACPPVIHRDIKSSNILLDDEWNARVADFGLSLLGPPDSNSPLSELPAGTLGYLDPEYYRLHYLTTKSDVYSFGVLLLEILSGRKAIDLQFDEGNIVEWAVPLIKEGKTSLILDTRLAPPLNVDALHKIAKAAARCVRMRGKDRPSMGKVTTSLERALALLMGTPSGTQLILPTEVVLGSSRLHKKGSCKSSIRKSSSLGTHSYGGQSGEAGSSDEELHLDNPVLASLTFPSVSSSQHMSSSLHRDNPKVVQTIDETTNCSSTFCKPEIGPASPMQE